MEVGGNMIDRAALAANSLLPSLGNQIDVRKYTEKKKKNFTLIRTTKDTLQDTAKTKRVKR